VQNYINQAPSYTEGQRQTLAQPNIAGGEPYSPNPQIDDIRRLFFNHIIQLAPPNPIPAGPDVADAIRRGLFTAGNDI
jgi:hypothetical protein